MKAIKIKMKRNCGNSGDVQDIESKFFLGRGKGKPPLPR